MTFWGLPREDDQPCLGLAARNTRVSSSDSGTRSTGNYSLVPNGGRTNRSGHIGRTKTPPIAVRWLRRAAGTTAALVNLDLDILLCRAKGHRFALCLDPLNRGLT